ncbi:MAG: hypothetical protein IPI98_04485 [Chitinophagaceae bacterium]|nr:hypothetical protein [Chitinophagaceae bacterium]
MARKRLKQNMHWLIMNTQCRASDLPKCGKTLTGSSAWAGGNYYYIARGKAQKDVHKTFEIWLNDISIKPEIASLYLLSWKMF